jgi:hypothetical protein
MKIILGLCAGLLAISQVSFAGDDVSTVPIGLGPTHFRDGDMIAIEQVVATSPNLAVGDKVTVRGRYVLKSEDKAHLCLYLATSAAVGAEPIFPTQAIEIKNGSGSFELAEVVRHPGHLHLSFYQIPTGTRFGSVYFGTPQQIEEMSHLKISN